MKNFKIKTNYKKMLNVQLNLVFYFIFKYVFIIFVYFLAKISKIYKNTIILLKSKVEMRRIIIILFISTLDFKNIINKFEINKYFNV